MRIQHFQKHNLPVEKVRRYLEPGPIVLVSSAWNGRRNIMTMGWHTVMEFSPSLVGCVISKLWLPDEMTQPTRDGENSMTVCQPMVMMLRRPFQAEEIRTMGQGSRYRRTFSTGRLCFWKCCILIDLI